MSKDIKDISADEIVRRILLKSTTDRFAGLSTEEKMKQLEHETKVLATTLREIITQVEIIELSVRGFWLTLWSKNREEKPSK